MASQPPVRQETKVKKVFKFIKRNAHRKLSLRPTLRPRLNRRVTSVDSTVANRSEKPRFRDIFLKSDLHGLPDWYQAQSIPEKITWTIIIIVALSLLIFELVICYREFRDNPILTTYSVVSADLEGGIHFPTVYVCPLTPFHALQKWKVNTSFEWEAEHQIYKLFSSKNLAERQSSILKVKATKWDEINSEINGRTQGTYEEVDCQGHPTTYEKYYQDPEYTPGKLSDYFLRIGYPLKDFIKECSFGGKVFDCAEFAQPILDRDNGKCFLIDVKKSQTLSGQGMTLVLNIDTEYAYTDHPPLFDGAEVQIGHSFDPAGDQKISLYPGTHTRLHLDAKQYHLIEHVRQFSGDQRCTPSEEGLKRLKVLTGNYSLGFCRMDCIQWMIQKSCDCVMPLDERFLSFNVQWRKDPICSYQEQQGCAYPTIERLSDSDEFKNCYSQCQVPCDYWDYRTSMSFSKFPSRCLLNNGLCGGSTDQKTISVNGQNTQSTTESPEDTTPFYYEGFDERKKREADFEDEQILGADKPHKRSKRSDRASWKTDNPNIACRYRSTQNWYDYVVLDIAFPSMQYVEITQEPSITFTRFVSEIGGQVGLWIGASIITMVKFFVITLPLLWMTLKKRGQKIRKFSQNPHKTHFHSVNPVVPHNFVVQSHSVNV